MVDYRGMPKSWSPPFGASNGNGAIFPPRQAWISLLNRRVWGDNVVTAAFAGDLGHWPDHRFILCEPVLPQAHHAVVELDNPIIVDPAVLAAEINDAAR